MDKLYKIFNIDWFGWWFICFGLTTQLMTYLLTGDTLLSFISGCAGVVSVVLCSQKRMSFYIWGFIQLGTFLVICYLENLYGKIFENVFYLVTMILGFVIWRNNEVIDDYDEYSDKRVMTRKLSKVNIIYLIIATLSIILIFYKVLIYLNGSQPLLDSISTVLAVIAQLLMVLRYRENWIFWFIVDLICIVLFIRAENWCMVVQYIFWTINCIYGYIKWK